MTQFTTIEDELDSVCVMSKKYPTKTTWINYQLLEKATIGLSSYRGFEILAVLKEVNNPQLMVFNCTNLPGIHTSKGK